jgi:hypothetical protein
MAVSASLQVRKVDVPISQDMRRSLVSCHRNLRGFLCSLEPLRIGPAIP